MGNFNSTPAPVAQAAYRPSFNAQNHAVRQPLIFAPEESKPAQTVDEIWQAARSAAQTEWNSMRSSYEASQKAFKAGDGAGAKAHSVKGAAHKARAKRLDITASAEIFHKLNHSRPSTHIDLHGQNVDAALKLVDKHMQVWRQQGVRSAMIIVGRGNHSANGPKIKYEVKKQLEQVRDLKLHFEVPNAGCITVDFTPALVATALAAKEAAGLAAAAAAIDMARQSAAVAAWAARAAERAAERERAAAAAKPPGLVEGICRAVKWFLGFVCCGATYNEYR